MFSNSMDNIFINTTRSRHNNNSFGPMTIHSSHRNIQFNDPSNNHWASTSLDSNHSSPIFGGKDLLVTPSNSTGHNIIEGFGSIEEDDQHQRVHQELFDKRRRRRESHNAVERRRRDNINDRIQELSTLLPDHLLESVPASANVMTITTGQSGVNGKPINKGTILKLSIDHIKELRNQVLTYKDRINDLERLVEMAKLNKGSLLSQDDNSYSHIMYSQQNIKNHTFQQHFK